MTAVPAHDQQVTHRYMLHYPEHPARTDDPHYVDFDHYHRTHRAAARCLLGSRLGYDTCRTAQAGPAVPDPATGVQPGLELHHSHVEFALQNAVDLALLEADYPGISDRSQLGAWVETEANFAWYCAWHHRGAAGVHTLSASDWEAERYVRGLVDPGRAAA